MASAARRGTLEWDEGYAALRDFAKRHGHCRVPRDLRVHGVSLYSWAARQRAGRERLSKRQCRQLESIRGWAWNRKDAAWERSFDLLCAYVDVHGHPRVPRSFRSGDLALGKWVNKQRTERYELSDERRCRLEELPGWCWDARTAAWHERLDLLRAFAVAHGHARVARNYQVHGIALGAWVHRQRLAYRRGAMTPDRVTVLEALPGWQWKASRGPKTAESVAA